MLEDLGKTVVSRHYLVLRSKPYQISFEILTGAQIPLSQLRNDAIDNLLGALTIAGHYVIPGTVSCITDFVWSFIKCARRMLLVL